VICVCACVCVVRVCVCVCVCVCVFVCLCLLGLACAICAMCDVMMWALWRARSAWQQMRCLAMGLQLHAPVHDSWACACTRKARVMLDVARRFGTVCHKAGDSHFLLFSICGPAHIQHSRRPCSKAAPSCCTIPKYRPATSWELATHRCKRTCL